MGVIDDKLDEWVGAGVLTDKQATRLREYEAARPGADAAEADDGVPTWVEVLGYLGAILVASGIAYLLFASWSTLGAGGKIAVVSLLLFVTAALGLIAHPVAARAAQRLSSLLLFIAVHMAAWLTFVVTDEVMGLSDDYYYDATDGARQFLAVAIVGAIAATAAYLVRRTGLLVVLLVYAAVALVAAVLENAAPDIEAEWNLLAWATVCLVATIAAVVGWLTPRTPAMVFAGLWSVLLIDIATWWGGSRIVLLPLALAIAIAYLGLAIVRRGDAALMIPGGLGTLVVLPQLVHHLFGESLVTWLAVIAIGVGLLVLVVWRVRGGGGGRGSGAGLRRAEL